MALNTNKDKKKKARKGRKRSQPGPDALNITHQEPVIDSKELSVESCEPGIESKSPLIETVEGAQEHFHRGVEGMNDKIYWPKYREMPTHYSKPKPLPCPKCKRVRLDNLGQCCVVMRTGKSIVYMRCKNCAHRWQLPVR